MSVSGDSDIMISGVTGLATHKKKTSRSAAAPSAIVDCIDLTSETPQSSLTLWRKRQREKDAKRAANLEDLSAQSSSGGSPGRTTRSQSLNSRATSSSISEVIDINADCSDTSIILIDEPDQKKSKKNGKRQRNDSPVARTSPEKPAVPEVRYKCPICLDTDKELADGGIQMMCLTCGHIVCKPCSLTIAKECPVCRKKLKKPTPIFFS